MSTEVIRMNDWDSWENYIREVETSAVECVIESCKRWLEFYEDCRENHGKQGGSMFAQFAKERFGISPSTASHRAHVGRYAEELCSNATKFTEDWSALYDYTRLDQPQKQRLIEQAEQTGQKIDRAAIKSLSYGHDKGDEWYTPGWLFESLGLEFDIDVCAPDDLTHVTTPARAYFTESQNGLSQEWYGTIWCNPPYSEPEPWALRCVEHGNGLLLTHIPMNASWCTKVWSACDAIRLFQAIEFVRPDGKTQRPGSWLQLSAFGERALNALRDFEVPEHVAENPRRVPSPMWVVSA
jgi:hypothetical protein